MIDLVFEAVHATDCRIFVVPAVQKHSVARVAGVHIHREHDHHRFQAVLATIHEIAVEHILVVRIGKPFVKVRY